MSDRSHMTPVRKIIAYSAIIIGILAVLLAFAFSSSIHLVYCVFTSSVFTNTATANIKGKDRQKVIFHLFKIIYLIISLYHFCNDGKFRGECLRTYYL